MTESGTSCSKATVSEISQDTLPEVEHAEIEVVALDDLFIEQYDVHLDRVVEYIDLEVEIKWPGVIVKLRSNLDPKSFLLVIALLAVLAWPVYAVIAHYNLWP